MKYSRKAAEPGEFEGELPPQIDGGWNVHVFSYLRKVWTGSLRYLFVAVALTASCGSNGCGSSGNGPSPTPSHSTAEETEDPQADAAGRASERVGEHESASTVDTAELPVYYDGPTLLVEIDKFGARVSGGSWFKAQPKTVRQKYAKDFKPQVVSAFRRLSRLKATGRTVGRSLFHPAIMGLAALLEKRAEVEGNNAPVPVELHIKRGVPFWLVAHFANFLLWNDGVTHLQVRGRNEVPPLLIARSGSALDEEPSCAQGHLLIRKGRGLVFWEPGVRDGLASIQHAHARPEWAGPPIPCGPWHKINQELFSRTATAEAEGLPQCQAWRVEAIDAESDWTDVAPTLARNLPDKSVVVLGNVNRPTECDD